MLEGPFLRSTRRRVTDGLIASAARYGELAASLLPIALGRALLIALGAVVCTVFWPFSALPDRVRRARAVLYPWSWGAFLGGNLAALLGSPEPLAVLGWEERDGARASLAEGSGVVVLSTHAGSWEAGARRLAEMGLRPLVIVAPWPLLPRSEHQVLRLRRRYGMETAFRGPRGWIQATRHLRDGGAVVVLVDSASASGRGRRALPFMGGSIAAPDAVVGWAVRNQAALWAAVAEGSTYRLHVLRAAGGGKTATEEIVQEASDRSVALFRAAVVRRPAEWAWIQPLVSLLLGVGLLLSSCTPIEAFPPLPLDPSRWTAQASGVEWSGPLRGELSGHLRAASMEGKWLDTAADGRFVDVSLSLSRGLKLEPLGEIRASEGLGRWPVGPFLLREATWTLSKELLPGQFEEHFQGSEREIGWTEAGLLRCGGCALERIEWRTPIEKAVDGG